MLVAHQCKHHVHFMLTTDVGLFKVIVMSVTLAFGLEGVQSKKLIEM